jgi:hypothetical protein
MLKPQLDLSKEKQRREKMKVVNLTIDATQCECRLALHLQ